MGLAPTTSTTMMLALGDAVAVALLERKGFSVQDFQTLHPGGTLGRKLLRVADIMHDGEAMPVVSQGTKMAEAILTMSAKSFGCVGVLDPSGRLVGIITDGDLRRHMSAELMMSTVDAVMSRTPRTIRPRALVGEALNLMNAQTPRITCLFVVDDGTPGPDPFAIDESIEPDQVERLRRVRETRDERRVRDALAGLEAAARGRSSIVPPTIEAVRSYATVGEISETLRGVFGSYQPDAVI